MPVQPSNPVIVGGGITGLTLADLWSGQGIPVTLVEKEAQMGGLARSIFIQGQPYDLGPHRFFTHNQELLDYILNVLGDNIQWIDRKNSVYMGGHFIDWPLTRQAIWYLPTIELVRAGLDLFIRSRKQGDNFEDFIINHYGPTLLRIFFKPMTEKFFRIPSKLVHPDWATAGVDRAIIEKYPHINNLRYLLSRIVLPGPDLKFIYPRSGGIQTFSDNLCARLISPGTCRLLNGTAVERVEMENDRVSAVITSAGERLPADLMVWTAPVSDLWKMLTGEDSELSFLTTIFFYLMPVKSISREEQWIYFPEEKFRINRLTFQSNFYSGGRPEIKAVCAEVTAAEDEIFTREPDRLYKQVIADLVRAGILSGPDDITHHQTAVVRASYPVLTVNYLEKLEKMSARLGQIKNLFLLGRSGMFWYNNIDNSINAALKFGQWLSGLDRLPDADEKNHWLLQARQKY